MSDSIFDNKFDNRHLFDFLDLILLNFWIIYEIIFKEIFLSLYFDFVHKY